MFFKICTFITSELDRSALGCMNYFLSALFILTFIVVLAYVVPFAFVGCHSLEKR